MIVQCDTYMVMHVCFVGSRRGIDDLWVIKSSASGTGAYCFNVWIKVFSSLYFEFTKTQLNLKVRDL